MNILAGLQSIPDDLYEAGRVDGATRWQLFTNITLPGLRTVILVTTLLSFIWTTNDFTTIYTLTGGGPGTATMTFPVLTWKTAFAGYELGKAAAIPNYSHAAVHRSDHLSDTNGDPAGGEPMNSVSPRKSGCRRWSFWVLLAIVLLIVLFPIYWMLLTGISRTKSCTCLSRPCGRQIQTLDHMFDLFEDHALCRASSQQHRRGECHHHAGYPGEHVGRLQPVQAPLPGP